MGNYGKFDPHVYHLQDELKEVRTYWRDQTAKTYDCMNENVEVYAKRIWEKSVIVKNRGDLVKRMYDEDSLNRELYVLASRK